MESTGAGIAAHIERSGQFFSKNECPEERPANFQHSKRARDESAEASVRPMIEVFGSVPKVFEVFQPQHISDSPPGLVGNAGQEVAAADTGHIGQRGLRIAQMFEHFHHQHKIDRLIGERQAMDIAGGQPATSDYGSRFEHAFDIKIHPEASRTLQTTEDHPFSTACIEGGFSADPSYHLGACAQEALVGELHQRTGIRILCLRRGQIRRRFVWT